MSSKVKISGKLELFKSTGRALNFDGKVVLVTGAAAGIGAETARLFAYLGAKVILTDIKAESLASVAEECHQLSPKKIKPCQVVADISKKQDIEQIVKKGVHAFGGLDILVNVAGILLPSAITDDNYPDIFTKIMSVNLESIVNMVRATVPYLNKTKGSSIVNISSIGKDKPLKNISAYTMSKAAITQLTRTLSVELRPNIRVNSISPGTISGTEIGGPIEFTQATWDRFLSQTPSGRVGIPLDIAKGCVFLSSSLGEWINGTDIDINGGIYGFVGPD